MKLIIGLGNPGKSYEDTKHNAGFIFIDELQKMWNFPEFLLNKKFNAETSEMNFQNEKYILAKPQTFMNLSGQSVRAIMDFYKLTAEDIVVVHDDLDINMGAYKVSTDSSSGGHNGVQNIIEQIGTQKFKRIRIGIEGTEAKKERLASGKDFVMQKFNSEQLNKIKKLAEQISL